MTTNDLIYLNQIAESIKITLQKGLNKKHLTQELGFMLQQHETTRPNHAKPLNKCIDMYNKLLAAIMRLKLGTTGRYEASVLFTNVTDTEVTEFIQTLHSFGSRYIWVEYSPKSQAAAERMKKTWKAMATFAILLHQAK